MKPVPRVIYTIEQLLTLDLLDSPCLLVNLGVNDWQPIQTGCTDEAEMLVKLTGTRWLYSHTTNEWIPVFYAVNNDVYNRIDITEIEVRNEYISNAGGYDREGMPIPYKIIGKKQYANIELR